MLRKNFAQSIIASTCGGLYVDEYQDCSEEQHNIICQLAAILSCRIFGDPLQAIFGFSESVVDWNKSVYPNFSQIGRLEIPWRWQNAGATALGNWLKYARNELELGRKISLNEAPKAYVKWSKLDLDDYKNKKRSSVFYDHLKRSHSVIAINSGDQRAKHKNHKIAQLLNGNFSSIEEVEGKDIFAFVKNYDEKFNAQDKLLAVLGFLKKTHTGVNSSLTASTKRGEIAKPSKATKNPEVLIAANNYLLDPCCENLSNLLKQISHNGNFFPYRRDLFNRLMGTLKTQQATKTMTLLESAHKYQAEFRQTGRPIKFPRLIGTTLLVKGLEYDHAIVINAELLDSRHLYVAMTRGSRSLTIISKSNTLPCL